MAATPLLAGDRTASAILKEIDAIRLPEADLSREGDKEYLRRFRKQRGELRVRRADLIGDLYRVDPTTRGLFRSSRFAGGPSPAGWGDRMTMRGSGT